MLNWSTRLQDFSEVDLQNCSKYIRYVPTKNSCLIHLSKKMKLCYFLAKRVHPYAVSCLSKEVLGLGSFEPTTIVCYIPYFTVVYYILCVCVCLLWTRFQQRFVSEAVPLVVIDPVYLAPLFCLQSRCVFPAPVVSCVEKKRSAVPSTAALHVQNSGKSL